MYVCVCVCIYLCASMCVYTVTMKVKNSGIIYINRLFCKFWVMLIMIFH